MSCPGPSSKSSLAHFHASNKKQRRDCGRARKKMRSPSQKTPPKSNTPLDFITFARLPFFMHKSRREKTTESRRDDENIARVMHWLVSVESLNSIDSDTTASPRPASQRSSNNRLRDRNAGLSHLELSRFRAFCNGIISAGEFSRFDRQRQAAVARHITRRYKYAQLDKPPPNIVERLYAAVGETVPDDIRENMRRNSANEHFSDEMNKKSGREERNRSLGAGQDGEVETEDKKR